MTADQNNNHHQGRLPSAVIGRTHFVRMMVIDRAFPRGLHRATLPVAIHRATMTIQIHTILLVATAPVARSRCRSVMVSPIRLDQAALTAAIK